MAIGGIMAKVSGIFVVVCLFSFPVMSALSLVGKGIRYHKVLFFSLKVYEAELHVSDLSVFKDTMVSKSPVEALSQLEAAEMRLKFLRGLSSEQVRSAFVDALSFNEVDTKNPTIQKFIEKIGEASKYESGQSAIISGDFVNNIITFVNPEGVKSQLEVNQVDIKNIFAIWLGDKMQSDDLQIALLGKSQKS